MVDCRRYLTEYVFLEDLYGELSLPLAMRTQILARMKIDLHVFLKNYHNGNFKISLDSKAFFKDESKRNYFSSDDTNKHHPCYTLS